MEILVRSRKTTPLSTKSQKTRKKRTRVRCSTCIGNLLAARKNPVVDRTACDGNQSDPPTAYSTMPVGFPIGQLTYAADRLRKVPQGTCSNRNPGRAIYAITVRSGRLHIA